jgi:hypothetical protein
MTIIVVTSSDHTLIGDSVFGHVRSITEEFTQTEHDGTTRLGYLGTGFAAPRPVVG